MKREKRKESFINSKFWPKSLQTNEMQMKIENEHGKVFIKMKPIK